MELLPKWFLDYDEKTLNYDFSTINYDIYPSYSQLSPFNEIVRLEYSMVRFENALQSHLISQYQMVNLFFTTELEYNDSSAFRQFSKLMLEFIKAEMNYCLFYWKPTSIPKFLHHRLIASLLRTLKFLKIFQVSVVGNYNNDIDINNPFYDTNPTLNSINDNKSHLLLRLQDLLTIVHYFEKSYGELYEKIEQLKHTYPIELNLIGEIYLFCQFFFDYNSKAISTQIYWKFPKMTFELLKLQIIKMNKKDIEEIAITNHEKSIKSYEEANDLENSFKKQMMSSLILTKMASEVDPQQAKNLVSSKFKTGGATTRNRIEESVAEDGGETTKNAKSNGFLKFKSQKESEKPVRERSTVSIPLSNNIQVKEKVDRNSLKAFKNSPNNPFANNSVMHSIMTDFIKSNVSIINEANSKSVNPNGPLSLLNLAMQDAVGDSKIIENTQKSGKRSDSEISINSNDHMKEKESKSKMKEEKKELDDIHSLINSKFDDKLIKFIANGGKEEEVSIEDKQMIKLAQLANNTGLLKKKTTLNFSVFDTNLIDKKNSADKKASIDKIIEQQEEPDNYSDKDEKNKKKKKKSIEAKVTKNKVKVSDKDFIKITGDDIISDELTYVASKEHRGDDIEDEKIMGNLIGKKNKLNLN